MIVEEVFRSIPSTTIQLYSDFITNNEYDLEYNELDNVYGWVCINYPPPQTVELLIKSMKQIKIRKKENPIIVLNKLIAYFNCIDQCIEITNTYIC